MLTLYPPIKPYAEHRLDVDDVHSIYVEECGNPHGIPVVFLHGGPGLGCDSDCRRFFDPERYRIILFDQRGAGRSTPFAELSSNTTQDLVADMEAIRTALDIDKWVLFGGSWGATLALVYAETYPAKVSGMILRGIFLCRQAEFDWFYKEGGASRVFPDYWDEFVGHLPKAERNNVIAAFHKRLHGDDDVARMSAAKTWSRWESMCSTLQPSRVVKEKFSRPHTAVSLAKIECHYFMNHAFIEENAILENASRLKNIPGIIVHGRYDAICPVDNAYALHNAWPESELYIVRNAGHSAMEPAILSALVHATNLMAR